MQQRKIGLALSGGGFRASFFHIGVLARLAELDLLREVEVISTVSGGSIFGALYYLHIKNLLEEKRDEEIIKEDYIDSLKKIEVNFLKGVQKNIRMRTFGNILSNFRMFSESYSRSDRIGQLYSKHFYEPVLKKHKISMPDLKIQPKGGPQNFHPRKHNLDRRCKVPILVLNATTLNTGHNWQFTATWMGEPPSDYEDVDKNLRLRRLYYYEAREHRHKHFPLGAAVAASACVPGIFHPLPISNLYEEITVQLVDGGVHDNQGINSLLEENCTHIICSDASGQMGDILEPKTGIFSVLLRSNNILMDRVREEEIAAFKPRLKANKINEFVFLHLKKDLLRPEKTWYSGENKEGQIEKTYGQTNYGVNREIQSQLSNIRTDLDSFSDVEAYSLMCSGYLIAEKQFDDKLTEKFYSQNQSKQNPKSNWNFLQVQSFMTCTNPLKQYVKHLKVGSSRFLKAVKLVNTLKTICYILLAAASLGLLYFLIVNWHKPLPINIPVKTYGSIAVAVLLMVIGSIPQINPIKRFRNFVKKMFKRLSISFAGFIIVWSYLILINPLFLKKGRISKLK
ncbi:MAG: patatin-like phospholipase family protein [bacterium]